MQQENVLLPLEKWRIACEAVAKFIKLPIMLSSPSRQNG